MGRKRITVHITNSLTELPISKKAAVTVNEIPQVQTVAYQSTSHAPASDKIQWYQPNLNTSSNSFLT